MSPPLDSFRSLVGIAVVAAIFTLVVTILLVANYARMTQREMVQSATVESVRQRLRDEPGNEQLRQQFRALDVQLRQSYFHDRELAHRGTWLMLLGVTAGILASTAAARARRRLPTLQRASFDEDPDRSLLLYGLPAIGVLGSVLLLSFLAAHFAWRSHLPAGNAGVVVAADQPAQGSFETSDSGADTDISVATEPQVDDVEPVAMAELRQHWYCFRGPGGAGVSPSDPMPQVWDGESTDGILWKTRVPLPGNNSPIVWGDRIYLSGATAQQQAVYGFDAVSGSLTWQCLVPSSVANLNPPPEVSEETGYAAPTMATDGRLVFAMFASGDLVAVDVNGRLKWQLRLGPFQNPYGHASSLTLWDGSLIAQLDQGSKEDQLSRLLAVRTANGETVWETPRDVPSSWATPIVVEHEGQSMIVTCADPWVIAYSPRDGRELWRASCLRQDVGPSPIYHEGRVIVANEFPGISAVRAGGRGDVTGSELAWAAEFGAPDTCSPLVVGQLALFLASYGTLTCYDAQQGGDPLWEEDFDDNFRSSPSLVGDLVYLFGESGQTWMIRPGRDQCEPVGTASLGEGCVTSPAFHDGRIFIRGEEHLFCITGSEGI